MLNESKKFLLKNIERETLVSSEKRADRNTHEPFQGAIKSCDVKCLSCHHEWCAGESGQGKIRPLGGGFILICPKCSAREEFHYQVKAF